MARKTYLKFPQIFPVRIVNTCDMHKSNVFLSISLDIMGEVNFQSKLRLRTSIFFHLKTVLWAKKRLKVVGTFKKFGGWGRNLQ